MQRQLTFALIVIALFTCRSVLYAQENWDERSMVKAWTVDSFERKGYTLIFINNDRAFSTRTKMRMIDAFFAVYPKEVATYNPRSLKKVVMIIDPAYKGVAATDNGVIRINPEWMTEHPEDLDVVTHEGMHIVQAYPEDAGPGWITEGIADYVRYTLGINNPAAGWRLPDVRTDHTYENAYRITARFLAWIERHQSQGLVVKLDAAMRQQTYRPDFWQQTTGKTLDELWLIYAANPAL